MKVERPLGLRHAGVMSQRFERTQLDEIDPVRCPCGFARRAFDHPENQTATLHLVDIQEDARTHYHKTLKQIENF